ncbi:MAG: citramalate synthase [Christensenellales bacterium]|jgi:2-isopropylmalate synthase
MVTILDTTLRDGAQGEGVVFSLEDKRKIIRALDDLGVHYIEAGNPASNPKDAELFRFVSGGMKLKHAKIVAFGSTCRAGTPAKDDASLMALASCGADTVSLFGKGSLFQVRHVLRTTPEENLRMIAESVEYLKARGLTVFYDAEHFFDGYMEDREYALSAVRAAEDAGADLIVLCDTNGGTLPEDVERIVRDTISALRTPVSIHCHNDAGLATAATLAAVHAGATQVQGTINGYGERCGNANLCQVIPNLALKMGIECLPQGNLARITGTARFVSEIANLSLDERSPYVGASAFAHKGGMHVDGVLKDHRAFEHVDPASVGGHRRFLLGEMSGRGTIMTKIASIAPDLERNSEDVAAIMQMLKDLESTGYSFEDAEESFTLRVLDALQRRKKFFTVEDFNVISRKPENDRNAQAYVKISVGGVMEINADEGNGPINALDLALRKALTKFYPCLTGMWLKDFKVRVVNTQGTASSVRVQIESTDGDLVWHTVGVSANIIEASFIALIDSIDYRLMKHTGNL